ncbi:hypothetical protein [Gordonia cholesterolivorans]|uniref:Uncharacterized protein n=1 Tax=Gordonia cholesterolivorans TaxID=559625 RepID=A0ABN3HCJ7_9ACTN
MTVPTNLLAEEHQRRWAEATYSIRSCELAMDGAVDPAPGSLLAEIDQLYRWEKVSVWSRSYLTAGIEHLLLFADLVAPYDFKEGDINHVRYLSYVMMGRAGLESAAHALWILDAVDDERECAERSLRLMYKDFSYQLQAQEAGGYRVDLIEDRMTTTRERAAEVRLGSPANRPPGYESLVRKAAEAVGRDPARWCYLWNAASGAAHGQYWFGMEGYDVALGEEYEPGHFRTRRLPDPAFITETVEAAAHALLWAVWRWLDVSGYAAQQRLESALVEVHSRMPKKS